MENIKAMNRQELKDKVLQPQVLVYIILAIMLIMQLFME